MIFEKLISDAKFASPQKNMIYQLEEFKKIFPKSQKLICKEFLKLGLSSYAKQYSELAFKHLTEAIFSLDLKNTYDLNKILVCIKENVIPFLKRDLFFQLNANKFQISKYANNLMILEKDHETVPQNLQQIIDSCIEHYKNGILIDRHDNSVKELSKKINKNKKILNMYNTLHPKYSNPYSLARDKCFDEKIIMIDLEYEINDLKDSLEKAKEENRSTLAIERKIAEQEKKYGAYVERQKKYGKIIAYNGDKLDEIISESNLILEEQKKLIEQQKFTIQQKALNKKMYTLMKQFNYKLKFHQTASISK